MDERRDLFQSQWVRPVVRHTSVSTLSVYNVFRPATREPNSAPNSKCTGKQRHHIVGKCMCEKRSKCGGFHHCHHHQLEVCLKGSSKAQQTSRSLGPRPHPRGAPLRYSSQFLRSFGILFYVLESSNTIVSSFSTFVLC